MKSTMSYSELGLLDKNMAAVSIVISLFMPALKCNLWSYSVTGVILSNNGIRYGALIVGEERYNKLMYSMKNYLIFTFSIKNI